MLRQSIEDSEFFLADPLFNLDMPASCPDVPGEVLRPRNTWTRNADYDAQAGKLAQMFAARIARLDNHQQAPEAGKEI